MVSLFEFIERFGISTVELYKEMESIHSLEKQAEESRELIFMVNYYLRDDKFTQTPWNHLRDKILSFK